MLITADARPAIQAEIDAVAARGGGTVLLPVGTFTIGAPGKPTPSLMLTSNVMLRGSGAATILRRAEGGYASPLIHNRGRTTATGGTGEGDEGIIVADLALDGNRGDTPKYTSNEQGLWLSLCRDSAIHNVWAHDHRTNGICLEYCKGVSLVACIARDNLKNGFYISGCDDVTFSGCIGHGNGSPRIAAYRIGSSYSLACSWHCTLSGCLGWDDVGASLLTGRDTQFCSVAGGRFEGVDVTTEPVGGTLPECIDRTGAAGPYDGTSKYGTSHSAFTGLAIRGAKGHGLRLIGGTGNVVADCIIRDVGLHGIMLHGSRGNTIRGCKISNAGTLGNRNYRAGICVVADATWPCGDRNRVEANDVFDDREPCLTRPGILVYCNPGGDVSSLVEERNRVGEGLGAVEIR